MSRLAKREKISIMILTVLVGVLATGYIANSVGNKIENTTNKTVTQTVQAATTVKNNTLTGVNKEVSSHAVRLIGNETLFSSEDLKQTADLSGATQISVVNNRDTDITKGGVYVIRGNAKESTITVNVPENDEVKLVLDGVNISNRDFPAIYAKSAGKIFVTTTKGSDNKLEVTGNFVNDGSTKVDSTVFSNSDLTINGTGKLTVISSTGNGVTSKNNLKMTGGTYVINSEKHGFEGDNSIAISDGDFTINTGKDGFHSENSNDNLKGYIYVSGGNFTINAEDDGIQATTFATIDGGTFKINAAEGIEATHVQINNGNIDIEASDDGINAAEKSTAYKINLEVNGGTINIVMAPGDTDAFDSNGDLTINGGKININANSPFDFDGTGQLNGGDITVNGKKVTELTNQFMGGFPGRRGGRR